MLKVFLTEVLVMTSNGNKELIISQLEHGPPLAKVASQGKFISPA